MKSPQNRIEIVTRPVSFQEESGLLLGKRSENGDFVSYEYDGQGRAVGTGLSSGDHYGIEVRPCPEGVCKTLTKNGLAFEEIKVRSDGAVTFGGDDSCGNVIEGALAVTSLCTKLGIRSGHFSHDWQGILPDTRMKWMVGGDKNRMTRSGH